jgi:hypothetical protein
VTRRERQQQQIATALARGEVSRALVLTREHLAEFPEDLEIQAAVEQTARPATPEAPEP